MSGRISTVVRGKFIDRTDAALRNPTEDMLRQVEALSPGDIAEFSRQSLGHPSEAWAVRHVEKEFLGDDPADASFPEGGGVPDPVTKRAIHYAALVQALRVALYEDPTDPTHKRAKPLPIVTYWISGIPQYEIYVSLSSTDREVHMFILTPLPQKDEKPPKFGSRDENMWAIGAEDRIKELRAKIPANYMPAPSFEIKGAHGQKLKSY